MLTSLGGESVHSLNQTRALALRRPALPPAGVIAKARELARYTPNSRPPDVAAYGFLPRPGYRLEKRTDESESGIQIPAVLAIPATPKTGSPAVLLANCAGKSASAERVDALARDGGIVLAIDIRGCGELTIKGPRGPNPGTTTIATPLRLCSWAARCSVCGSSTLPPGSTSSTPAPVSASTG
ncbi:MAG: hypothetical protein NTX13_04170 [Acidobacteria bacterium]|nr:hypothetical protein [Acidobacteriota bacterium]